MRAPLPLTIRFKNANTSIAAHICVDYQNPRNRNVHLRLTGAALSLLFMECHILYYGFPDASCCNLTLKKTPQNTELKHAERSALYAAAVTTRRSTSGGTTRPNHFSLRTSDSANTNNVCQVLRRYPCITA